LLPFAWRAWLSGQVTYERLLDAGKDPGNWLTYRVVPQWRYAD